MLRTKQGVKGIGTIALGIQSTNDCTYTRTSNIVNRNPRTFYFFQNSYCCSPFSTTSAQYKSHLQAWFLYRFLLSLYGKTTTDKDKKYKKCTFHEGKCTAFYPNKSIFHLIIHTMIIPLLHPFTEQIT